MSFVLGKGFVDIDVNSRGAARQVRSLQSVIKGSAGGMVSSLTRATAAVAALGVAFGVAAVREASKFSEGVAEINTLLRETDENVSAFEDDLSRLARTFGTTLADNVNAAYDAVSAFPDAESDKVIDFLDTATRAGIAGRTDTATAGDVISTLIQAFSMDISEAEHVADALFTTIRRGKTRLPELASVMGTVAPPAKAAGIEMEELLALMAGLTRQGVRTRRAGTALRAVFNQLLKPSDALATQLDMVSEAMGVADIRQQGAIRTLQLLSDSVDGNADALAELFPNIRGVTAVFAVAGENASSFTEDLRANKEEVGAMGKAYSEMEDESARAFRKLRSTIQVATKDFGEGLLPAVQNATEALTDLIDTEGFKKWGQVVGDVIGDVIRLLEDAEAGLQEGPEVAFFSAYKERVLELSRSVFGDRYTDFIKKHVADRMMPDLNDNAGILTSRKKEQSDFKKAAGSRREEEKRGREEAAGKAADKQEDAAEKQGDAADNQTEAANQLTDAAKAWLALEKELQMRVDTAAGFDLPKLQFPAEGQLQEHIDFLQGAKDRTPDVAFKSLDQRFIDAQQNANNAMDEQLKFLGDQLTTMRETRSDIGDIKIAIEGQPAGLRLRK